MLHGNVGVSTGQLGYSLFTQFLEPLENDPDLNPPDHTGGIRLTYDTGPTLVGRGHLPGFRDDATGPTW